jgi:hypothetical protein
MADQVTVTFRRSTKATCEICGKDRDVFVVSFDSSAETSAFCWSDLRKMLSYRTAKLSAPAQTPTGNGAEKAAGRASS